MRRRPLAAALLLVAPSALAACGLVWTYDDYVDQPAAGAGGAGGAGGADGGAEADAPRDAGRVDSGSGLRDAGRDAEPDGALDAAGDAEADAGGDADTDGGAAKPDPNVDGPYAFGELDDVYTAKNGDLVGVHCVYPTSGPASAPYPVVIFAHGFKIGQAQYAGYLRRLASFGYVAVAPEYPSAFGLFQTTPDPQRSMKDFLDSLDWVAKRAELAAVVDLGRVGASGHQYGGKLAFLAATVDPRIRAAFTLDPADTSDDCEPDECDVSAIMAAKVKIPVGMVGEKLDVVASPLPWKQPCAPKDQNFETFYAGANAPALSVEVLGAANFSFLENKATCGAGCTVCEAQTPTLDAAIVRDLSKSFLAAFFERWLREDTRYDDDLTGDQAKQRYVVNGLAIIQSK